MGRKSNATAVGFGRDLTAVLNGEMTFDKMIVKHNSLLVVMAKRWRSSCSAHVSLADLLQEARLAVVGALKDFEPERHVPIESHVRSRVFYRLWTYSTSMHRGRVREWKFLSEELVEERIVQILEKDSSNDNAERVYITVASDRAYDSAHIESIVRRVCAHLTAKQRRIFLGVLDNTDLDVLATRVFVGSKRPRKAALRAIRAAQDLVERFYAEEEAELQRHGTSDHQSQPVRSIDTESHPGQGYESAYAC